MQELIKKNADDLYHVDGLPEYMDNPALIQPIGCAGSDHSNVKPHGDRLTRGEPMLFIGGPLDGKVLRVPADGRMYDHERNHNVMAEPEVFRYVPSVISFDGMRRMVYILFSHVRPEQKPAIEDVAHYQHKIDTVDRVFRKRQQRLGET